MRSPAEITAGKYPLSHRAVCSDFARVFKVLWLFLESSKAIASATLAGLLVVRRDEIAAAAADIVAASMWDAVERLGLGKSDLCLSQCTESCRAHTCAST